MTDMPPIKNSALHRDGTIQHSVVLPSDEAGVLIVDDTPSKLAAVAAIVSGMELQIVTATSGQQALSRLLKQDFALILLDVNMPTMDGFETAKLIRSHPRSEHTPIIFVTAEANSADESVKGYALGAVDFIYSPIRPEILRAKVQAFIKLFYLQRELLVHNEQLESLVTERTAALTAEVAERRRAEENVERLNRVYTVLSKINALVVRFEDRQDLFKQACRIAVEDGQFGMAWIGVPDQETLEVSTVAFAGIDVSELRSAAPPSSPIGLGQTDRAIREKRLVFCNNIALEPSFGDEEKRSALRLGVSSMAALPFIVGEVVVGSLTLLAKESDFFSDKELLLLTEMAGDISFALDHIEKEERLHYLAYFDITTGLPNRALFHDRLTQYLLAASKNNSIVALLGVEIEQFRFVNDTLGRHAGDSLLKQVAERLRDAGLAANHLAHNGAGLFTALLDHLQKEADVAHILERRINDSLQRPFVVEGTELRVSARAGIALYPADGTDADALLRNATAALGQAKLSGDRYQFCTPEINARVAENLSLETKLRHAVANQEFVLHYQPKVELKNGSIVGVESLIRWQSPELGLVPPLKLIHLLEETGVILEVGAWVLRQAVIDYRRWMEMGLAAPRIAVNVSIFELRQSEFVDVLREAIDDEGRATGIDLEITESLIMDDVQEDITKLRTVRDMGMSVTIDDFGTGYSSIASLAKLPVHAIKIDRAFVASMLADPNAMLLVETMISLAQSLGLKVIAEGVDDEEQAMMLRLLSCDEMQGNLFSPAVTAEQIERMLREENPLKNRARDGREIQK
jgi:diguanylate cyclase (GGDEF)-like protein